MIGVRGGTFEDLSRRVNVPPKVMARWLRKDPKIREAYGRGIDTVMMNVEAAAIKRAVGYDHPKTTVTVKRDAINGRILEKTTVKTMEHIPGDPGSQKFLLSKRMSKRYPCKSEDGGGTKVIIQVDREDLDI